MNCQPNITPLVSSYEQAISKNREHGFDKDLLGQKSTLPSPFSPERVRRRSEAYLQPPTRKLGGGKLPEVPSLCPMSLLDAMDTSTFLPRQHHGIALTPQSQSQISKEMLKEIRDQPQTYPAPMKTTKKNTKKKNKKSVTAPKKITRKVPMVAIKEDEEMKALRQKIASLKAKVHQTEQIGQDQLLSIYQDKKDRMRRFQEKQQAKGGPATMMNALDQKLLNDKAQKQQKIIEDLRNSNKKLRQDDRELVANIRALKEENAVLESDQSCTQLYYDILCEFHNSDQDMYGKVVNVLPKYRNKMDELDSKAAHRAAWIDMEHRIKQMYDECLEAIVSTVETRCQDTDLVDQVVSMSLGLDMDMDVE